MQLLLRADVPQLGEAGDIVDVKPGYARNYLLPKRLATDISDENVRVVQKQKKIPVEQARNAAAEIMFVGEDDVASEQIPLPAASASLRKIAV